MKTNITHAGATGSRMDRTPRYSNRWRAWPMGALALLAALVLASAKPVSAAGAAITGSLSNFDIRYPGSLPNDLDIFIYGDGLVKEDVIWTYPNPFWSSVDISAGPNTDPTSPAFGLDCVRVRYSGPPLPPQIGQMLHFGVRLKPGRAVAHQEVWWTLDGQRILRPCDPHVTWICTTRSWLVCIANPTPQPIYIYGCRWFAPAATAPLPPLDVLNTAIDPGPFGGQWTSVAPPVGRVFCIPAWCRIYIRIPVTTWRPIVFQIAARNVGEEVLPLPTGEGPHPEDWNGEIGTMAILTTRPTEEFAEDLDNNGGVGASDFNLLRSRFGQVSSDLTGN